MKLIIRESDLRDPFGVLAALARRCETTDYDATDGWHVLMAAIKYLQKQGVEADAFREGKAGNFLVEHVHLHEIRQSHEPRL